MQNRRVRYAAYSAAVVFATLAGCSSDDAVRASALKAGTGTIVAERRFSIGAVDGAPEYAFGQIAAIVPSHDGGFFVCDFSDRVLRQYDSAGVFVRNVGRSGAGPGEYQSCYDAQVDSDGGVVVSDPPNGRLVRFNADGTARDVLAMLTAGGLGGPGTFFVDARGRYWRKEWLPSEGVSESDIPMRMLVFDRNGRRVDSLLIPAPGASAGRGFALSTNDGMYLAQPVDSLVAIGRDGALAVAGTRRYHVRITRGEGNVLEFTRGDAAVPYADAEWAEWDAWRQFFAAQTPQFPPAPIARTKPLLRELRFDDVGRLWVKLHVTAEPQAIPPRPSGDRRPLLTWRERNTYDLFDGRNAAYVGRVSFPYATQLMATRGDRVWLREEGSSGEQVIGVYDLRPVAR